MDDQYVKFGMDLRDGLSPVIAEAAGHVKRFGAEFMNLKGIASGILGGIGVGFAAFKIEQFVSASRDKFELLEVAEANLSNTMRNMGTFSQTSFEKIIDGASELERTTGVSRDKIVQLQAQLGELGNIGADTMDRLTQASLDMSAKFGTGPIEAARMLSKAMND